ncbi:hypothetical protein KEM56_001556 [Ascosphaera pollenicola]|nr:hypothetical protein KEM56_001556 [Ascosphaera pollenicola]
MFAMRSEEKSWAKIQKRWEEMTGERALITSIRARYHKVKHNLAEWSEEDIRLIFREPSRLIRLEAEIEEQLRAEKWTRLAEAMVKEGSQKYSVPVLQKKLKELQKPKSE